MKTKITISLLLFSIWISQSQNLEVFDTFAEFQNGITNNCTDTNLTFEDFDDILAFACETPILPDSGQLCFGPDELVNGFTIQGVSQANMAAIIQGSFGGTPINLVGPNNREEVATLIDFSPNVYAVSLSTWYIGGDVAEPKTFTTRVIGEMDELLGTYTVDTPDQGVYSFHVISDVPIIRVETSGISDAFFPAGLFIGNLYFGASNCQTSLSINSFDDISNSISIYPNPSTDIVNINFKGTLDSIEIFNVSGQSVLREKNPNNNINVSGLESGIYFIKFKTNSENIVKKLIKK